MWEVACERVKHSVHGIVWKEDREGLTYYWPRGTAFLISCTPRPLLLTNAHVVTRRAAKDIRPDLVLVVFLLPDAAIAGLRVRLVAPHLDLAVLEASNEARRGQPITFSRTAPLPVGAAVASMGFPLQDVPDVTVSGGRLNVKRRLATGFISSPDTDAVFPEYPWTAPTLPQYELNMFAYPGISGGPVLTPDGDVIGINRGSRMYNEQEAAYACALRNQEVLQFLDQHHIPYHGT